MLLVLTEGRLCNWYSRGIYEFTVRRLDVHGSRFTVPRLLATEFLLGGGLWRGGAPKARFNKAWGAAQGFAPGYPETRLRRLSCDNRPHGSEEGIAVRVVKTISPSQIRLFHQRTCAQFVR